MNTIPQHAKPVRRLVDVRVEATFSILAPFSDLSRYAEECERRVREFNHFIRDHRSQDDVHLKVVQDTEEVCCLCGNSWEQDTSDKGNPMCAWCGEEMEPEGATA